jgi:hypothetical protein
MPSIGHIAVGAAAGRLQASRNRRLPFRRHGRVLGDLLLPDADRIAFLLGIPYGAAWGRRGAAHSPSFALAIGAAAGLIGRAGRLWLSTALLASADAAGRGTQRARVAESTDDRATVEASIEANGKTTPTRRGTFVAVKERHPAFHRW